MNGSSDGKHALRTDRCDQYNISHACLGRALKEIRVAMATNGFSYNCWTLYVFWDEFDQEGSSSRQSVKSKLRNHGRLDWLPYSEISHLTYATCDCHESPRDVSE